MPTMTLRDDDAQIDRLLAEGAQVISRSWGARLVLDEPPDLDRLHALVRRVSDRGLTVTELTVAQADQVLGLEDSTREDYPDGPATPRPDLDADGAARLFADGGRVFGVWDGAQLIAVTAVEPLKDRAETTFTSVRATHRGAGVATAVKAASVLALAADGVRVFGTGGAGTNAASLGMNRAVGYQVAEQWLTLAI